VVGIDRRLVLVPVALAIVVGTLPLTYPRDVQGSNYASDPVCQNLLNLLPANKSISIQRWCETRAGYLTTPSGVKSFVPGSPTPFPTVAIGGPVYGIVPKVSAPFRNQGETYNILGNIWLGPQSVVYAAALSNDPSQGLVIVTDRGSGPLPPDISATFEPPRRRGR
jgi:hypothetical protein